MYLKEHGQQVEEGDCPTPLYPDVATSSVPCPVLGSSVQRRQSMPKREARRAQRWLRGLQHLLYEEQLKDVGLLAIPGALRRRLQGDLITVYKYLKCRNQVGGPGSFLWRAVTEQGVRGKNWNIRSSKQTWGRISLLWGWQSTGTGCPKEVVKSPSLEIFKICLDLTWATYCREPALAEGLDFISRRPFQTLQFCDSGISSLRVYQIIKESYEQILGLWRCFAKF